MRRGNASVLGIGSGLSGRRFILRWVSWMAGLAALAVTLLAAPEAARAQLTWDPAANGTTSGGAGTWNSGSVNWWTGSADTTWGDGNDAVFQGTGGSVTVSGPFAPHNLVFNVPGYTLTGSTINLSGGTISVPAGTTIVNSKFGGASNLVVTGSGILQLGASSSYTGSTTITSGTLQLGSNPTGGFLPSINIAIGAAYSGGGVVAADTGTTWNTFSSNVTNQALVNSAGGATAITITMTGGQGYGAFGGNTNPNGLLHNGVYHGGGQSATEMGFTFGGLSATTTYKLYCVTNWNQTSGSTEYTLQNTGATIAVNSGSMGPAAPLTQSPF